MEKVLEYYAGKVDFNECYKFEGEKRLNKCAELNQKIRDLIWDALPKDLSDNEKRIEMIRIFYERDFTPEKFEMWLTIMRKEYGLIS